MNIFNTISPFDPISTVYVIHLFSLSTTEEIAEKLLFT